MLQTRRGQAGITRRCWTRPAPRPTARGDPRADLCRRGGRWCGRWWRGRGWMPAARQAIVRARGGAGGAGARAVLADGDGGVPRGVRAFHRRGGGADVPRRGAAPGAGRGHHRRADRRQDRAVELGGASRAVDLEPGQCGDLGAAHHRAGARRRSGAAGGGAAGDDPAAGGAGGADGGGAGDEADGGAVRAGRDHRQGDGAGAGAGGEGVHLLLRHARRGGADRAGRAALCGGLCEGDRGDRRAGEGRRGGEPGDLGEAVGLASALRVDAPGRGDGGAGAAGARAGAGGGAGGDRVQHRRGRGGAA